MEINEEEVKEFREFLNRTYEIRLPGLRPIKIKAKNRYEALKVLRLKDPRFLCFSIKSMEKQAKTKLLR